MKWTREQDGYRSGRYFCQRHEVDDREFDGGYLHTYWNLLIDDQPFQQHQSLADAKSDAERIESRAAGAASGPHRHQWDTQGASANGTVRTCSICGEKQVKESGRWKMQR